MSDGLIVAERQQRRAASGVTDIRKLRASRRCIVDGKFFVQQGILHAVANRHPLIPDLPPQAVRDVDFLEPRVGYEVRDGRLERKSHFVLFERTGAPSRAVFHGSAGEASDVDGSDGEGDDRSCRAAGSKAFLHDIGLPIGEVDVHELSSDDEVAYF